MCFDENTLQAYIDQELDKQICSELEAHLEQCANCRSKLNELKEINDFVNQTIKVPPVDTNEAWFICNKKIAKKKGVFSMIKKYKKYIAAAAAIVFIAASIIYPPVTKVEAHILSLFRLNKFQTIAITPEDIQKVQMQFQQKGISSINLQQFGDIKIFGNDVSQTFQPSEIDKFRSSIGYNISLPQVNGFKIQNLSMEKSKKIQFKLNVDKVNNLIKTFGGTKLFPENLKGKIFTINLGDTARIVMGKGEGQAKSGQYFSVNITKIPEITVPEGVNLNEVRDAIINLPFLPDDIRRQIEAIKDWKSTIPVPIATDGNSNSQVQNITINGNPGILVTHSLKNDNYKDNALVWIKGDVIYSIESFNLSSDQIIEIARTMR